MKPKNSIGAHGLYQWIEFSELSLLDLLKSIPSLAVSKYLVNTSYDSGFITLTKSQIATGWHQHLLPSRKENLRHFPDRITFTPAISIIEEIPIDFYDEWYAFNSPISSALFDDCEVFVNWCGFSLIKGFDYFYEKFWSQIETVAPETYLCEGENLICVTKNAVIFEEILHLTHK